MPGGGDQKSLPRSHDCSKLSLRESNRENCHQSGDLMLTRKNSVLSILFRHFIVHALISQQCDLKLALKRKVQERFCDESIKLN
jgi:hypothetical protein